MEWDRAAAASWAVNFRDPAPSEASVEVPQVICRDIVGWEPPWSPGEVDVVVGGPPCQGFSGLNRNRVRAERNTLWQEFIRVVLDLQPKVFVIENVDRFLRSPEFSDLEHRLGGQLANYRFVEPVAPGGHPSARRRGNDRYLLNAADFGARQARRRAIVIGVRTDVELDWRRMRYPEPTHSREDLFEGESNSRLFRPDFQPWLSADEVFEESIRLDPPSTVLPANRAMVTVEGVPGEFREPLSTRELHVTRSPESISIARYQAIPSGGGRKDLRGRYLCTLEGEGGQFIVEKVGPIRSGEGALIVDGEHLLVKSGRAVDGLAGDATVVVASSRRVNQERGRSRSEVFDVEVLGGPIPRARLEYLSTPSWDAHDAGSGDVMGRVRHGRPSVTIRTEFFKPEKGRYLHPTADRPLTHFEAARLQGFPEEFKWCGSKTEIARQIGNAVPIPLAERIAESIYEYLRG